MKILQIVFCILSCVCVAAVVLVGIFFGFLYALIPLALAVLFGVLMMVCKKKATPPPPKEKDFMDED